MGSVRETDFDHVFIHRSFFHRFLFVCAGAEDPTFLKEPSDKIVFGLMSGLCFFGCMNIVSGLYSMSYGVNKV